MMHSTKLFNKFFYAVTITAFVFQLIMPTTVYADGETPPVDPAPTSTPVDEATPVPTDVPTEEVAPLLADVPPGTDVVVLDENGQPLPLATQAAAEVIIAGDPMWCPDDVANLGAHPCSSAFDNLMAALTYADGETVNGTIWIASGSIFANSSTSDTALVFNTYNANSLTLQGGWTGTGTGVDLNAPSVFSVPLKIWWGGPLTINNLTVDGGASPTNTVPLLNVKENGNYDVSLSNITVKRSASGKTGLTVTSISSSKNVTLNSVNASNNGGHGAELGGYTANYTITNSTFSNNGGQTDVSYSNINGLIVTTTGNISLDHVTANGNSLDGAQLNSYNGDVTSTGTVTVTNSTFGEKQNIWNGATDNSNQSSWGNRRDGLSIISAGATSLNTVTADYNGSTSAFGGDGIVVKNYLTGGISLSGVTANHNYEYGADLTSAHDLDVTGSTFNYNRRGGVLTDIGGHQNFTTTEANYNYYSGLYLGAGNSEGLSDFPVTTGDVSLTSVTTHDNGWGWSDDRTNPDIDPLWAGISTKLTAPFACSNYSSYDNGLPDAITCIEVPSGGGGEIFSGNEDDSSKGGFDTATGSLIEHVSVKGGELIELNCASEYNGFNLELPKRQVFLPCTSFGETQANSVVMSMKNDTEMPSAIDAQFTFLAGMEVTIVAPLSGGMTVSFDIPEGMEFSNLSILFWDGGKWVDLGGYQTPDGLFNVSGTNGGVYVLVKK